jgi:hypothetical protein
MKSHLELYKEAVKEEIAKIHALGLPVYQAKNGYIVAIYPDGRVVNLEKEKPYKKIT